MFTIRMGVPEMETLWNDLIDKNRNGTATKDELRLYKRLGKTLAQIAYNPRHPGLHTHDIDALTVRYGMKVWQSYLENNISGAGRVFWVYGPEQREITVIGVEPHPDDKSNSYKKITLSKMGNEV